MVIGGAKPLNFVAIDVETANSDMASICQVGLAKYVDGQLVEEWSSLVDPKDYFDPINVGVHGITKEQTLGSPTFRKIASELGDFLNGAVCVSHTHFDRVSISRALKESGLEEFATTWLDSAKVARRTWPEFAKRGYGLANVCKKIGYEFRHHDALEDAKACGRIILAAAEVTGLDIEACVARTIQPINPNSGASGSAVQRDGNPEGELYGEVMVFTGALEMPRREAADLAARIGCNVSKSVTKKTSFLVVGDQDVARLAGADKSSKHRRVEELIQQGQSIRIVRESDFIELVRHSNNQIDD